jgi:hypothetical protein
MLMAPNSLTITAQRKLRDAGRCHKTVRMIGILAVLFWGIAALTNGRGELTLAPADFPSRTNSLPPAPDGDRFLFIVDTSSSTKKLSLAAREALVGMIYRGLDGRMTNGDTFGVWTVGSTVQAGQFPMQVWDETQPLELASLAGHYIRAQSIGGKADFSAMLSMLNSVVTAIKDVNVFLITDGETKFKGTQLDQALNGLLEAKRREARRLQQPVIVTLATRGGRVAAYSVTIPGERIGLPPRPPRVAAVKKPETDPKEAQPSQTKKSIIITKSDSEPFPPPSRVPAGPANTSPPASDDAVSPPATNPAPNPVDLPLAARKVPPPPMTPPATTPEKPESPVQEDSENDPPTIEKIPTLEPPERPLSTWVQAPSEPRVDPALLITSAPGSSVTTTASPSQLATLRQQPLLVSARERGSNPVSPAPAPQAAAAPAATWTVQTLLIIGSALFLVALFLLLLVIRYHRRVSQPSFITRSMDRR